MTKGLLLDRYEILEHLGQGGFSQVYKAYDTRMEREVAIKEIPVSPKTASRAIREAKTTAFFNHPNIVTVYDFAQTEDNYYLIMECIEGISLSQILEKGRPLTVEQSLAVAIQVASALECAHLNEVIHRDIKPENLMLLPDGRIKVMDFGIARLTCPQATSITAEGDILGTLAYMPPEQVEGGYVDEGADIFSLGVVTYQMLTGISPFEAKTPGATILKILNHEPPPLSKINPEVPKKLDQVILKALDKESCNRFDTVTEMRYKLERSQRSKASPQKILKKLFVEEKEQGSEKEPEKIKAKLWSFLNRRGEVTKRVLQALLTGSCFLLVLKNFSFYPQAAGLIILTILPLVAMLAPSLGIGLLMIACTFPIAYRSLPLGILVAIFFALYWILFSRRHPTYSLVPIVAPILGYLGMPFLFPLLIGLVFSPILAATVALLGCTTLEIYLIFGSKASLGPLSLGKSYHLLEVASGSGFKDIFAAVFSPYLKSPFLLAQIAVWGLTAIAISLITRKRRLSTDLLAILLGSIFLSLSYNRLPTLLGAPSLPLPKIIQSLSITLLILFILLLFVPYKYLKNQQELEQTINRE